MDTNVFVSALTFGGVPERVHSSFSALLSIYLRDIANRGRRGVDPQKHARTLNL